MLAQAENLTLWSRKPGRDPYAGLFCLALTGTCLPATTLLAKRSEMAGLLSRARGPDREVSVEKPGLPSAGLLFLVLPALHRSFTNLGSDREQRRDRHDEVPHLSRSTLSDAALARDSVGFRPRNLAPCRWFPLRIGTLIPLACSGSRSAE